jgi:fluoroacetyl-CoA thioesterase
MKRSRKKTAKRRTSVKHAKPAKPVHSPDERRPRLGLEGAIECVVPHEWTIAAYDPRLPAVLSTPAMIGMMEIAAAESVLPELPPGVITVGTRIAVDHLKAVPEGATVRATSRLLKHQGRFLVFDVEARSGENILGRGRVFRAIVEPHKFGARADSRKES